MKKILIVEDDITMNRMITHLLIVDGYDVHSVYTAAEACNNFSQNKYDLAILDINLPDGSGYNICEAMRQNGIDTSVIFLTANDLEQDMLKGYELGAADYITKPFSNEVLRHKLKAIFTLLEKSYSNDFSHNIFDDGYLYINFLSLSANLNGKTISFAPLEYRVLEVFVENKGILLTRQKLFEKLWDHKENYIEEHTLTATISRIRGKIEQDGEKYIQTVYGMGYIFNSGGKK